MSRWRKWVFIAGSAALSMMLCACAAITNIIPHRSVTPLIKPTPSIEQAQWDIYVGAGLPDEEDTYFIKNMPADQKELCIAIYQGIMAFTAEIKFPQPVDEKTLSDVMWLLSYDCPELFQISGDYSYYVREDMPEKVLSVKPNYILTQTEYEFATKQIQTILEQWLQEAASLDVFEAQLLVYRGLINNCTYKEEGAHTGTAYGALVLGEARCEGYSKALCMAFRAAGIPSLILTGEAWTVENGQPSEPEKHAWNVAKIGDSFYQMDPTWDDSDGQFPQETCYAYFNLTDEQMYESRQLDDIYEGSALPVCNSTEGNYFVRSGSYFTEGADLKAAISDALSLTYDREETHVRIRVETDKQLMELQDNLEGWMTSWCRTRHFRGISCKRIVYEGSRVFCIFDLQIEK